MGGSVAALHPAMLHQQACLAVHFRAMERYLGISEIAERTGLALNTIKAYSQIPGRLPEPDAVTGRIKGWLPETIDAWLAQRS